MELYTLLSAFEDCVQSQYNGNLDFNDTRGNKWKFYYHLGQIVWATGGIHPHRRWLRNITLICPQLDIDKLLLREEEILIDYWDYLLLENLYHKQEINQIQFNDFVVKIVGEQLFDLAQQVNVDNLSWQLNQETILKPTLSSTNINMFLQEMKNSWYDWSKAGSASLSPHSSPVLKQPEKLRQQVSPIIYQNFERLINGKNTFWDLAAKMQQNIVSVMNSLRPFINEGIVEVIKVHDVQLSVQMAKQNYPIKLGTKDKNPLIICIDDSLQISKILDIIIRSQGMRFMGIQDSSQAISISLKNKPDLIFLDLIMPMVNGYEICEELRRISIFNKTPIIILTGSDGAFDRVKAKVYGANAFISKPIKKDQVLEVLNKYLQIIPRNEDSQNFP
jgi:two-component system, chemotaxis family, response regulator PixG